MRKADETMLLEIFKQVPSNVLKDVGRQEEKYEQHLLPQERNLAQLREFQQLLTQEREQSLAQCQKFERILTQERERSLAQRQELERRLTEMHQQHITGMGSTGRAGGRGSGSKPGGSGRRFFTTLPKRIILDGGEAFLSSSLTSGHRRISGYLGPFAMAKPNETVTVPWRRLLDRLLRKW